MRSHPAVRPPTYRGIAVSTDDAAVTRDVPARMMNILINGSERLLKLQAETVSSALSGSFGRVDAPTSVGAAMSTLWQLPALYGALFEEMADNARRSFHIVSGMQNELVDLACESLAHSAPVVAEAMSTGNALFADRRHRSVVIHFPERRHLRAWRAS